MICYWQDLDTGEVFQRPDEATCRREAIERMNATQHKVYVSRTRIPPENGEWWRLTQSDPPPINVLRAAAPNLERRIQMEELLEDEWAV